MAEDEAEREAASVAELRVRQTKTGSMVEIAVPGGANLEDVFRTPGLIDAIRGLRGCQTCTSGDDLLITERFQEVVRVDLRA